MSTVIALDIGDKRVGVAIANDSARIAQPHVTLENNDSIWQRIQTIIEKESVHTIVAGLPRSLDGQETAQTTKARAFADLLKSKTSIPIYLQDEAGTSLQAKAELDQSGRPYDKAKIDAQAASIILQDYLSQSSEVKI